MSGSPPSGTSPFPAHCPAPRADRCCTFSTTWPPCAAARVQELVTAGLAQTFMDDSGDVRIRLTDRGWALAQQLRKEAGDVR